ncbi:diadenosine tetraphosphatase ApaH/serine/threonine PP2A family protein phosphatase [Salirhabdus euzebyi]|uniref:Diadenosine tetraphosphatase ApaH/serine/threonine PP2A family protein phosphatase n=1 Tax=Salirhabdus euzebyi TaxID=394506 RepID=A0A841Q3W8_9BACI|nr:bis(5'-nucleosyl)-tetraphosphatase PrpE [Salirhabdus euzebyi]MBB6453062.1 diadenosine tetraphosphatase ApaH/serine/threonine PP2A family protein phosphatase [Salirhabdus euzebyi]
MKYDIIGDIHGCLHELQDLFDALGYRWEGQMPVHPEQRIPVFVGDLTDRGPASIRTVHFVYDLVMEYQKGKYVPGNHCNKLYRFLKGNPVKAQHGLETTVAEYEALPREEKEEVKRKFMSLYEQANLYEELKEVNTVVAHAGIKEDMIGRKDKKVETFVFYGDITGKTDEKGMPERKDWAKHYKGDKWIVYGHTPIREPRFINKTVNIDTGCVFGGALTAFRLPEEKIISVPSKQPYKEEKFRTYSD